MKLTLIEKKEIADQIFSFIFKADIKLKWKAGQYLIYSLEHKNKDLRGKMRFFTISASPFENYPTITTKIAKTSSSFKKTLSNLKIGDEILAKGPDGDFVIKNANKKYIFIAGGIGITPFISIIRQLNFGKNKINVTLLYCGKNDDLPFRNELEKISKNHKEFRIKYFINKRVDKNALQKFVNIQNIFYVSGPDPMVEAMQKLLIELGISKENIKEDYFSGYKNI
jgi:ferredoxin-NADP reductase